MQSHLSITVITAKNQLYVRRGIEAVLRPRVDGSIYSLSQNLLHLSVAYKAVPSNIEKSSPEQDRLSFVEAVAQ